MVEAAVELDDDAMTAYLDGNEPDEATLKRLIRKAVLTGAFYPVLCGSAFKNKGVQTLLDAVVDYLPSPLDVRPIKGIDPQDRAKRSMRQAGDDEPLSLLAFKIMDDPFVGVADLLPHLLGQARDRHRASSTRPATDASASAACCSCTPTTARTSRKPIAGDIVALAGLKDTRTGDTLCDPNKPVILERMEFPEPVIEIAVEPKTKADQEKMASR